MNRGMVEADAALGHHFLQVAEAQTVRQITAVQLHGAMGVMNEMPIGHGLARLISLSLAYGNTEHHVAAYARLSAQEAAT